MTKDSRMYVSTPDQRQRYHDMLRKYMPAAKAQADAAADGHAPAQPQPESEGFFDVKNMIVYQSIHHMEDSEGVMVSVYHYVHFSLNFIPMEVYCTLTSFNKEDAKKGIAPKYSCNIGEAYSNKSITECPQQFQDIGFNPFDIDHLTPEVLQKAIVEYEEELHEETEEFKSEYLAKSQEERDAEYRFAYSLFAGTNS